MHTLTVLPTRADCTLGCNVYCSRTAKSPVNGSCADAAAALRMPADLLVLYNPDIPCNSNATGNSTVDPITANVTVMCVAGTLRPKQEDILDKSNPNR